jgi:pimeloyl-ACP methyl ester carboxylesterase
MPDSRELFYCSTFATMKVYFISGIAADRRVFKNIRVPAHCEIIYLNWIAPKKKESLSEYALRMAAKINTEEPFSLVGLSMGGMVASEIARQFKPVHTIIISSVPSSEDFPVYFKWASKLGFHKLVPVSLGKSYSIIKRLFTAETKEDKEILKKIIRESDPKLTRWSVDAIVNWKTTELPASFIHIHGTKDEVLPIRFTQPTHKIVNGGHMMIMNRADEINRILQEIL